jgi:hypothetical protein
VKVKKILILGALLPAAVPGISMACSDLSTYRVDGLVFNQLPLRKAIEETLKGTPYSVIDTALQTDGLVSATGVSGPLDQVLADLLGQFSMSYVQNGCDLTVVSRGKQTLRLMPGDMLNEKLAEWLKAYGYSLFWDAPKYRVSGALSVTKSVEDVLKDIASVMNANGVKLVAEIYDNRAVRVTEVKQ